MSIFENDPALVAITEDILHNGKGIWQCISPEISVPSCEYKFAKFDNESYYKIPKTKIAGCAYPNEIECVPFVTESRATEEHYLDKYICNRDVDCFNNGSCNSVSFNWEAMQAKHLMKKLMLSHEMNVVAKAFDVTKFTAFDATKTLNNGMKQALTAQAWDPTSPLLATLQKIIADSSPKYNKMVVGRAVMNAIRRHPDFLGAGCVISNLTDIDSVRDLLEIDEICVSDNYFDQAAFGAPQDLKRFVSDKILFFHRSNGFEAAEDGEANFSWTAKWRDTFSGKLPDDKRGGRGGYYLRTGWDIDLYMNHKLGFLLTGVQASQP